MGEGAVQAEKRLFETGEAPCRTCASGGSLRRSCGVFHLYLEERLGGETWRRDECGKRLFCVLARLLGGRKHEEAQRTTGLAGTGTGLGLLAIGIPTRHRTTDLLLVSLSIHSTLPLLVPLPFLHPHSNPIPILTSLHQTTTRLEPLLSFLLFAASVAVLLWPNRRSLASSASASSSSSFASIHLLAPAVHSLLLTSSFDLIPIHLLDNSTRTLPHQRRDWKPRGPT